MLSESRSFDVRKGRLEVLPANSRVLSTEHLRSRRSGGALGPSDARPQPRGADDADIFGALSEFERALIRERTQAGLKQRARGRLGGRKKRLNLRQRAHAVELYRSRKQTVKQICSVMGISRANLYAYVEELSKES